MASEVGITGTVGDVSPLLFNKTPFLEIEYPLPYIPLEVEKKQSRTTTNDTIKHGLNVFVEVTNLQLRSGQTHTMLQAETDELIDLLKGGVIFNGGTD